MEIQTKKSYVTIRFDGVVHLLNKPYENKTEADIAINR